MRNIFQTYSKVNSYLKNKRFNSALKEVFKFGLSMYASPECMGIIPGSRRIDLLCQSIADTIYEENVDLECKSFKKLRDYYDNIYLVSKLSRSGGHSLFLYEHIKSHKSESHLIILTERYGQSDVSRFDELQKKYHLDIYKLLPASPYNSIVEIQKCLSSRSYKYIHLIANHLDVVAFCSLSKSLSKRSYFWHHADHKFTLGLFSNRYKHVDLHPMSYYECRSKFKIKNYYYPLRITDSITDSQNIDLKNPASVLCTVTVANSNKVEFPYYIKYKNIVVYLLRFTTVKHLHIGRLSLSSIFYIRFLLFVYGVSQKRFIYVKYSDNIKKDVKEHSVDLHIASFPIGAALTTIDLMSIGVPVVLNKHIYTRVLDCIDLVYPGAFVWENHKQLIDHINSLTPAKVACEKKQARKFFLSKYDASNFPNISFSDALKIPHCMQFDISDPYDYDLWGSLLVSGYRFIERLKSKIVYTIIYYRFFYYVQIKSIVTYWWGKMWKYKYSNLPN